MSNNIIDKILVRLIKKREKLVFDVRNERIYYIFYKN